MLRQLLAFALAGSLVLEAPAALYTAAPQINSVMEETSAMEETAGEDTTGKEETTVQETESEAPGETTAPETETETAKETTAQETETEAPGETTAPETETDTAEEITVPETETDMAEEITVPETETETPEEIPVPEISVLDAVSAEEIQPLTLEQIKKITFGAAPEENVRWVSFTAPEDGCYKFTANEETCNLVVTASLYKGVGTDDKRVRLDYVTPYFPLDLCTDSMQKGETVYLHLQGSEVQSEEYPAVENLAFEIKAEKIDRLPVLMQTDGGYKTEYKGMTINVTAEAGYGYLRVKSAIEGEGDYRLKAVYREAGGGLENNFPMYLTLGALDQDSSYERVEENTEYEVYFILMDASYHRTVLAILPERIKVTTKATDKAVAVHDIQAREDSITLDAEILDKRIKYCYYAPTDGSQAEKGGEIIQKWDELYLYDLQPETEYRIRFCSDSQETLFETKASTTAPAFQARCSAELIADDKDDRMLKLTADISGYKGEGDMLWLEYEYTNALGETVSETIGRSLAYAEETETGKKLSVTEYQDGMPFLAGNTYEVTMKAFIRNPNPKPDTVLAQTVEKITPKAAFQASDITFSLKPNLSDYKKIDVTAKIAGLEEGKVQSGRLYLKMQGSVSYRRAGTLWLTKTTLEDTIGDVQKGAVYDIILFIGGVKKEAQVATLGEPDIKLTKTAVNEDHALEIIRSFKVESKTALSGEYYLYLEYFSNDDYHTDVKTILNADNGYEATVIYKTAPDTDYQLRWALSTDGRAPTEESIIYDSYESVHTKKADITAENIKNTSEEQKYKITVRENMENRKSLSLDIYYRKAGEEDYVHKYQTCEFNKDNDFTSEIHLTGLEAETKYEVSLRSIREEYFYFSFTTPKSTISLKVSNIKERPHYADIAYTVSGVESDSQKYVALYIREKKEGAAWEYVECRSTSFTDGSLRASAYEGKELKEETVYEYILGIGERYQPKFSTLRETVAGEFTTKKDNRTLSDKKITTGYRTGSVQILASGNDYGIRTYIFLFYREKGKENWTAEEYIDFRDDAAKECSWNLSSLKANTEYEYAIVIADSDDCKSPDEITAPMRKSVGNFRTKMSKYTIAFEQNEEELRHNSALINLTAKGSEEENFLQVELTLSDGQKETVVLKKENGYKNSVVFTNLLENKEYKITKADISAIENGTLMQIASIPYEYAFTTKKAKVPDSITLSQEELALNAAYPEAIEGINRKILTADVQPKTAAADIVWSSSDETVAVVSDGTVNAKGSGTAVITAASKYDKKVKAECLVTVKDYAVGRINSADTGTGVQLFEQCSQEYPMYKRGALEGFGLYERESGKSPALVSDFTVTFQKSGILAWTDGRLQAEAVGRTQVFFEKDGVKALLLVNVAAEGKGFGITGFSASDSNYPAVIEEDGSYTLANVTGLTYKAEGEISPSHPFVPADFTWSSSDEAVASVSKEGVITPKNPGSAVVTIVPKVFANAGGQYLQERAEVTLHVKNLPTQENGDEVYALANTSKKIKDVAFPASWGKGWSWKYPDTPLVTNGVNKEAYPFEAVYNGDESYPGENELKVYIGRITGAAVEETSKNHNRVLEAGERDFMTLSITPVYQGTIAESSYSVEIPDVKGLTIEKGKENGAYKVTASKAGVYTLRPVIKAGDIILAKTTYKITAVKEEQKQVGAILLSVKEEGITIEDNTIIFDSLEAAKDFTIEAQVKDRYGNFMTSEQVKLTWKSADKAVTGAAALSKKDTHTGKITPKAAGHTVIAVTANDKAKYYTELNIEIQDHAPRVGGTKAEVNIAYNYNTEEGKDYAEKDGTVEIVPVYGERISTVQLFTKDGISKEARLAIEDISFSDSYLIKPVAEDIPKGTYDCILRVETNTGGSYDYPLKVKVIDKAPAVTVKANQAVNLFYTNAAGRINLNVTGNRVIDFASWEDLAEGENNGFFLQAGYSYIGNNQYNSFITVSQQDIGIEKGALKDKKIAEGTLKIKIKGYRKTYIFNNFKIKYSYKKPDIITKEAVTSVIPNIGINTNYFYFYSKTDKNYLYYGNDNRVYTYNEVRCDNKDVELSYLEKTNAKQMTYTYCGGKKAEKLTFTINSANWRESVQAAHTVKTAEPKAYLTSGQLIYNTMTKSTAAVYVNLKMGNETSGEDYVELLNKEVEEACVDFVIEGANAKAKKLTESDLLTITANGRCIEVKQNQADFMEEVIPAGTYSYKIKPYYKNRETGEKTALNTLTLKVKIVNQPVKAKISPKGSLNLANGTRFSMPNKTNVVVVNPVFSNLGSEYSVTGYKLTGEYSKYFKLTAENTRYGTKSGYYYYITPAAAGKLKAGQSYKLAVKYTITAKDGKTFTVTSNTFTIKPKQSAPKVTIKRGNNQTLYAAANITKSVVISPPAYYTVESAEGSLDCNKDGKADITISGRTTLKIEIKDRDAVGASVNGKNYSVPVTVKLAGRDGISKDVKITVKVKVKR